MNDQWRDRIVGDRMTVDQEFTDRVAESTFTRQQWGLIMTAVQFDVEDPGDDEDARLVADTTDLPAVIPELDKMERGPPGVGGPGGSGAGGGGGGIFGGLKDALGIGDGSEDDADDVDQELLAAAERLTQEYADELQAHLEERGKWADIRDAVQDR
jgi:hypothetical protein